MWHDGAAASLDQYMRAAVEREMIPGLAIAVAQDGVPVFEQGYGYRDVARQLPATPDTVFGVASVTKSFACLAIMQLADRGRLNITDPVGKWLPEAAPVWPAGQAPEIRHLMSHTAGLPGMQALFAARAGSIRQDPDWQRLGSRDPFSVEPIRTVDELMAVMAATPVDLLGRPGECINYSNEGFALLQAVIERASGQPFREYLREHVLNPLGMDRSVLLVDEMDALRPDVTELYAPETVDGQKRPFHSPVWWGVGDIYTNGSLKSTVRDLLRYLEVYRTGGRGIVSARAVAQMMTPMIDLPTAGSYGLGLQLEADYHGTALVGHGGSIKGVSAQVLMAREAGVTVAVLTNLTGVLVDRIALAAINLALGLPADAPKRTYPMCNLPLEQLRAMAGRYVSDEAGTVEIIVADDGAATVKAAGQTIPVRPYAPDGLCNPEAAVNVRVMPGGLFSGVRYYRKV